MQTPLAAGRAVGDKESEEYLEVQGYADAADRVYSKATSDVAERDQPYLLLAELREVHRRVVGPAWDVAPPVDFLAGEGPGSFRLHDILHAGFERIHPFRDAMAAPGDWS